MRFLFILLASSAFPFLFAQNSTIQGFVTDQANNQPLSFVSVQVVSTDKGAITDDRGFFEISGLLPGVYALRFSFLGYQEIYLSELSLSNVKPLELNIQMEASSEALKEVVVQSSPFQKKEESPLSLRSIGVTEIARSPGSNRDISKVVKALPGVTRTVSFRNDLIIRGGAPNENRFYLDDVEVPNINHFATQGSTGGPVGMINVTFLREVDFYSGAFPAGKGNALSSVFDFKMRSGRNDRIGGTLTMGSSDFGITLEGPIQKDKTSFIASARRSYLQFLFKALELPFLPVYNDFQIKVKHKFNTKHELTFIGLGAIDDSSLNTSADKTETQQYILNYLPSYSQWNYTNGLVYKYYQSRGYLTFVLSRNMLDNQAEKFAGNDDSDPDKKILSYASREIENKLRIEYHTRRKDNHFNLGFGAEDVQYGNRTFNKVFNTSGAQTIAYETDLRFYKYYSFLQYKRKFYSDRWSLSLGVRNDGNSYSEEMRNPFLQTSPRAAISFQLNEGLQLNATSGLYYQMPAYTILGYRENEVLTNRENEIRYIQCLQHAIGFNYDTKFNSRFSMELYLKRYAHYPLLLRDSITLANLGGDFGVIGAEPAIPFARGISYGMEWMYQQKLYKGFYGIISYTFGKSEFEDKNKNLVASSWDSRHILNLSLGKQFRKSWEAGINWRFQSGLPYTPFSADSDLRQNWDVNGRGVPDYKRLNTLRNEGISQVDIRIDKKWFFKKWNFELYLDVENVTGSSVSSETLILDRPLDADNRPIGDGILVNPNDPLDQQRYKIKSIADATGNALPSIGITLEW